MKIIKRFLLAVLVVLVVVAAGFYLYIKSLPTAPPQFVAATDVFSAQAPVDFSCDAKGGFNYAYQVDVLVESKLNDQLVYRSELDFKLQMQQAASNVVKGLATHIVIDEGRGAESIEDVAYLSRVEASPYSIFTAYNPLALHQQHPMSVLSQVLKALSVGAQGEAYYFTYDPLQRTYRYRHKDNRVERASFPTTADASQLMALFSDHKSNWKVVLGDDCVPVAVESEEIQGIASSGSGGYIRFRIEAKLIPSYTVITGGLHDDLANAVNSWVVKSIDNSEFADPVHSRKEMWGIFSQFSKDKNVAQLVKAAQFMIENVPATELSMILQEDGHSDGVKRDLIFALGIARRSEAEAYMINVIEALPLGEGNDVDLQKVRLMVAVSGNGQATDQAYTALHSLLNNSAESENVHKNALLSMGALVAQLSNNGQDVSGLHAQLSQAVLEQLQSGDSAAAILAAGNAGLEGLGSTFLHSLSSTDDRERYAAGTVLARDYANYDALLEHIASEPSDLVVNAIVKGMQAEQLSVQQLQLVKQLQADTRGDRAAILNKLLGQH